ncbi:peroxiredoxin-like family protein [Oleiagrimonas sp. C23AA]|uniref:peroxiredoxin-like family protein n=1 Tax=Oleiagrimonas sp. C23AA TaxID=2719047 RepID=UPI00141E2114|nr:peroxiredoxin-like family protein [Oleiagrimonas sp. C23AA]NII09711.1 AhpC/TSA family protein [Oleiagrimonas sp. C23AA]
MTLQAQLDALREKFEGSLLPAEAVRIMHDATDQLAASGQAERALKAGDRAPDFSLPDPDGAPVSLASLLADGPLVLTFYRGVWCPYCNADLKAIEATASRIRELGASLAAISPQVAANSRKSQRDNDLSFPILSDHGNQVAAAFGLRFALPPALVDLYKRQFNNDLAVVNGEPSWTLPMPARYVIGSDGVIAYAEVNPDYTRRPEPADLLPVLEKLHANA